MAVTEYLLSLSDLITRARQRADMVGSSFVSDAEIQDYIDAHYRHLYMKLVSLNEDMFLFRTTQLCTASTEYIESAKPLMRVRLLEIGDTSATPDRYDRLRRLNLQDLERVSNSGDTGKPSWYYMIGTGGKAAGYGNFGRMQIQLRPIPDAAYRVRVTGVPYPVKPSEWDDAVITGLYTSEGVVPFIPMLDDYLAYCAAIDMKDKEESDTSVLERWKADWWQATEKALTPMDDGEPQVVGSWDRDYVDDADELNGLTFGRW